MPLYSPGRRRAILVLILTSVLLLTIDLRGSAILSAARTAWSEILRPFESAAEVAGRPIRNAWRGVTDYGRLEDENRDLRIQIEAQLSNDVRARASVDEVQALKDFLELEQETDYDRVVASLQGASPTNLDQIVEIDKGQNDGLREGMPVVTTAGFVIGKVHRAYRDRSEVMLITDERYFIGVRILTPADDLPEPQYSVTTTTSTTTTTTIPASLPPLPPDRTLPEAEPTEPPPPPPTTPPAAPTPEATEPGEPVDGEPGAGEPVETEPPPTTVAPLTERETGALNGRGTGALLEVTLVADTPMFGTPQVGDYIVTAGGRDGLAPPNMPIGIVEEVERTSPARGLTLRVRPFANTENQHFVAVVLYVPSSEAGTID